MITALLLLALSQTGTCKTGQVCDSIAYKPQCVASTALPACTPSSNKGRFQCQSTPTTCIVFCNGVGWSCVDANPADGGSTIIDGGLIVQNLTVNNNLALLGPILANVGDAGVAGDVLTSRGNNKAPHWQPASAGGPSTFTQGLYSDGGSVVCNTATSDAGGCVSIMQLNTLFVSGAEDIEFDGTYTAGTNTIGSINMATEYAMATFQSVCTGQGNGYSFVFVQTLLSTYAYFLGTLYLVGQVNTGSSGMNSGTGAVTTDVSGGLVRWRVTGDGTHSVIWRCKVHRQSGILGGGGSP